MKKRRKIPFYLQKIFHLMGTLDFWEVSDNHIPTAMAVLLNRKLFQTISFTGRDISEKEEEKRTF